MNNYSSIYPIIRELLNKDLLTACYRFPGSPEVNVCIQLAPEINSGTENLISWGQGFVFAPFDTEEGVPLRIHGDLHYSNINLLDISDLQNISYNHKQESGTGIYADRQDYLKTINDVKQRIRSGDLEKMVLSRAIPLPCKYDELPELYLKLLELYANAFVYLVNLPGNVCWMGASPELLVKKKGNNLKTMALAGTRKTNSTENPDMPWGKKERDEQKSVQKHIEDTFQSFGVEFSTSKTTSVSVGGNLEHLSTEYSAAVNEIDIWDFVNRLHPTPAVCGYPVNDALHCIRSMEVNHREFYTGFLGPVNGTESIDLFVNLRCLKCSRNGGSMYVGGGITAASVAEDEWQETVHKSAIILNALNEVAKI